MQTTSERFLRIDMPIQQDQTQQAPQTRYRAFALTNEKARRTFIIVCENDFYNERVVPRMINENGDGNYMKEDNVFSLLMRAGHEEVAINLPTWRGPYREIFASAVKPNRAKVEETAAAIHRRYNTPESPAHLITID